MGNIKLFFVHLLYLLLFIGIYGCTNNSCDDPNSLNSGLGLDSDGPCRYTKVIFYAGSNRDGGTAVKVVKIEVFQIIISEYKLIGTIDNIGDVNPAPVGCLTPIAGIEYEFPSGSQIETRFSTRYYYEDGSDESGDTYMFAPEYKTECIVQNLTL